MSVLDNLNRIKSCKEDIKQAIEDKGVDMTDVAFTEYATKISEIQTGGGSGDYLDMRANMSTYYSTVEKVGAGAFYYCSSLQSVNLPMCEYVGVSAFYSCKSLQSVNLPMCKTVFSYAFYSCKSLKSIDLPDCTRVDGYTFNYCSSLESANLPMCESLKGETFTGCSKLKEINIQICSVISYGEFSSCKSLSILDLRSTYSCILSYSDAFSKTPFASGVGSIYVHNTVLSQFQTATNWTYFSNCLVGVGDPTRPLLSFDSGRVYGDTFALYSTWMRYLGITSSSIIFIDLPNVKVLSSSCFSKFSNLIELSMEKLTRVALNMCSQCSSLQVVDLPMCEYVGSGAFYYCKSLQLVNLPMCKTVYSNAFCNCKSLKSIDLPDCTRVDGYTFNYCSSLQSVNLPMCEYVGVSAFQNCSSLQSVNLPMCSYVDTGAFYYCSSLQSVNLPMCEYVGGSAFYDCNATLDVYIGTSISKVCQAGGVQIFRQDWNTNKYLVNKIFVPMSLVDAYKSAQYWSEYASHIFGI